MSSPLDHEARRSCARYLLRPADAYCFSPSEYDLQSATDRDPPSHGTRKTRHRRLHCPCDRTSEQGKENQAERAGSCRHWHPNQLRHSLGTEVRQRFGLEAAQVVLGHSKADVTQVYAERDQRLAVQVARQVG